MVPYLVINIFGIVLSKFLEIHYCTTDARQVGTVIVRLCLISRSNRFCRSPAQKPGGIVDLCVLSRLCVTCQRCKQEVLEQRSLLCDSDAVSSSMSLNSHLICLLVLQLLALGNLDKCFIFVLV